MKTPDEYVTLAEQQLTLSRSAQSDAIASECIARAAVYVDLARLSRAQAATPAPDGEDRPLVHPGGYAAGRTVSPTAVPRGRFTAHPHSSAT